MKYLGAALFILSAAGTWLLFSARLREKALICRELIDFCSLLSIDISFRKNSLFDLIRKNGFKRFGFIEPGMLMSEKTVLSPLSEEENAEISRFVYSLGKSGERSQILLVEGFKKYMEQSEKRYLEKYKKDARLYPCLGLFFGAAVCLALV